MSTLGRITCSIPPQAPEKATWAARVSLVSACLAWMFDAMDLTIFTLILVPSVSDLIASTNSAAVAQAGGLILAVKLLGWGAGGIVFGVVADRIGRARTMIITVLIYSAFTGLSGLAQNTWQLAALQAAAGIGIGGEWAAGAALVAETWPERTRARALIIMQLSFAGGFFLAALVNLVVGPVGWRYVLAAGAAPAGMSLLIRRFVPEPERWIASRSRASAQRGAVSMPTTFLEIFGPDIRRRTVVGLLAAASMMIGAWGSASLLPIWVHWLAGSDGAAISVRVTSQCFMLANVGAVFGYIALIWLVDAIGRRWSYFLVVTGCAAANLLIFTQVQTIPGLLWSMPIYGFFAIGGFGVFATYLPELFPTRMRATGQGFCWNAARVFTAIGPLAIGTIAGASGSVPLAAATVTAVYAIGLVAIWFGPETRGMPLPD